MSDELLHGLAVRQRHARGITLAETILPAGEAHARHAHASGVFSIILSGVCVETRGSVTFEHGPSAVAFHPPDEEHALTVGDEEVRRLDVFIADEWLLRMREVTCAEPRAMHANGGPLVWLGGRLYEAMCRWSAVSPLIVEGLVLETLAVVGRTSEGVREQWQPRWVERLDEVIRVDFARSLTVVELAARVGVHPIHLSRTWRRFRGTSIGHYVQQLRIDAACQRMAAGCASLAALALEVGFCDQTHFSRVFKQHTGMTPAAFRSTFARFPLPAR